MGLKIECPLTEYNPLVKVKENSLDVSKLKGRTYCLCHRIMVLLIYFFTCTYHSSSKEQKGYTAHSFFSVFYQISSFNFKKNPKLKLKTN